MSHLKAGILFLLLLCLAACGRQVVEFGADGGGAGAGASGGAGAGVRPTVISTLPLDDATGVAVDVTLSAKFSQAMDAATLDSSTFVVTQGATSIAGSVTFDAPTNTVSFQPTLPLTQGLIYIAVINTGAKSSAGLRLAADHTWSFTTVEPAPGAAPTVTATTPLNRATDVAVGQALTVTFSQAMDPATLSPQTFKVEQDGTSVTGAVTFDAATNTATFTPTDPLGAGLVYTATITTGAMDSTGLALGADYTWTFTVAASIDRPTVIATLPAQGATGVLLTSSLSATFSKAMDPTTIGASTFTVTQGATLVGGAVSSDNATNTAKFVPAAPLSPGLVYTATLTTGITDASGVALAANFVWTFTTAPSPAAPTIVSTVPADRAINVSINNQPSVTFSTAMDPTTITNLTFTLQQGLVNVPGVVTYNVLTNTATFTPLAPLGLGLGYTATVSTGAKSLAGVALTADHSWSFSTAACSQLPIVLGAAAGFAVLAGSTVTSTGLTTLVGDLGVSPGTAIVGFPPGTIVGTTHAGDPTAAQGIAALALAYIDAAGRTLCPVTVAGNLGGQTLAPGLYKSTTSLAVSSGDLTLDAGGDGNAVFIFQMASTLTTTSARKVILTNGAKSANVYWQVGTSATLGTSSVFQGTIMADQAITLGTGAALNGRALAHIAAVSLDGNAIVKPLP